MVAYKNILKLFICISLIGISSGYAEEKLDLAEFLSETSLTPFSIQPTSPSLPSPTTTFNSKVVSISPEKSFGEDVISPCRITDLAIDNKTYYSISLIWTAPGDDNTSATASTYDIRYAVVPITDENWSEAIQIKKECTPNKAGTLETFTISDLSPNTTYYFAIKSGDEIPNWSPLSKVVSGMTLKIEDTDMPQTIKFILGGEYSISAGKFIDSFMLIGLNTYNKLNKKLTLLSNFQLSSTSAPHQSSSMELVQKSLEYNVGLLFELYRFHLFNKTSLNGERHAVSLGFLLRGGGVSVDDSSTSILFRTFYGIRFLSVGKKFNGAYLDIGGGRSENFTYKEKQRLKMEGFLPIFKTKFKNTLFISWFCDSDGLGDKKDELKFTLGTAINI